ncbi:uncharacterized protein LOC120181771 [Hibiscus syriacus]|uniref:uncharacterized protein LOC120181771 n=1 Tax=Hibiscus syriacus TaxID=106335 RepID=UPI001923CA4D|nr:uncharacterized protein LOC120181771 [Hibiscus syriacus]
MEAYSSSSSSALARGSKDSQPFHASLHSVRKPIGKPGRSRFRHCNLVSPSESGAPPQPPPVRVAPPQPFHVVSRMYQPNPHNRKYSDVSSDSLGFNLSPSSYSWCTFPILSPKTLSSLDQSSVP